MASQYFLKARTAHASKGQVREGNANPPDHKGNPFRIAISGTSFKGSIKDLVGYLQSIKTPRWNLPRSRYRNCTTSKLDALQQQFSRIVGLSTSKDKSARSELEELLESYPLRLSRFLSPIMIRRTGFDLFFNYRIIDLPRIEVNQILCATGEKYHHNLQLLADKTQRELQSELGDRLSRWVAGRKKGLELKLSTKFSSSSSLYYLW